MQVHVHTRHPDSTEGSERKGPSYASNGHVTSKRLETQFLATWVLPCKLPHILEDIGACPERALFDRVNILGNESLAAAYVLIGRHTSTGSCFGTNDQYTVSYEKRGLLTNQNDLMRREVPEVPDTKSVMTNMKQVTPRP